ncbi:MAG TPA: AsmA family protein, partial [Flavobacterium sp.]|nr:AsmA family protein [Flavobacterium sp.]
MRFRKIALYFGIFLSVLLVFILLAPQLFKKQIETAVKEASKEFITTPVAFRELNVSFFTNFPNLSVSLKHLTIDAPKEFHNLKTVETQSVDLGIDVFSLFGKQIKFTKLYVNEGKFRVVTDTLGNFSFGIFKTSEEPSDDAPFDLALQKISIKNSNVLYQDDASKIKIETKNTSIQGKIQVTDQFIDFDTNADIRSLFASVDQTVYVDEKPLKGKINTRVYLDPMAVEFKENDLFLAELPLEIKGKMSILKKGIDFDLNVLSENASLAHLFSLVPKEYEQWYEGMQFGGTSDIQVIFKGMMQDSVSNPNLNVNIGIAQGVLSAKAFSADPVQNLNTKIAIYLPQLNPDSLQINIPMFDFTLGKGFAKGKALYKMPMYVEAEIKSELDVTQLWKTLAVPGMKLGGMIALDGAIKGNYTTKTKVTKSGVEVSEIVSVPTFDVKSRWENGFFQWNEMPMPIDFISFDMVAKNTDGNYKTTSVDLQNINIKAGSNYVKGRLKIDDLIHFNTDTDLQAFVNLEEIKKIVPIKEVDFAGELTIDTKAKGKLNLAQNRIPVVTSIVKLKNGYLKYNSLPDLPLEKIMLETHITSPRGSLNDLRVNVLPISFVLAGEPFHIDAQLFNFHNLTFDIGTKGKLNLDNIYKVFAVDGWNVEGSLEANLNVKGKGGTEDSSSINNRGFVLMNNIRIKSDYFPHDFVFTKGRFNFFKNKIKMKDVVMKYGKQSFVLNGELENYINYFLTSKATLKGKLDVTTDYLDVNSFMATSTTSSTSSGVVLLPDAIRFELSANAKKVKFNDMVLTDLKGLVKIADQKMNVEST